eukprot:7820190-Pyramimonas_sp.AAC.1
MDTTAKSRRAYFQPFVADQRVCVVPRQVLRRGAVEEYSCSSRCLEAEGDFFLAPNARATILFASELGSKVARQASPMRR